MSSHQVLKDHVLVTEPTQPNAPAPEPPRPTSVAEVIDAAYPLPPAGPPGSPADGARHRAAMRRARAVTLVAQTVACAQQQARTASSTGCPEPEQTPEQAVPLVARPGQDTDTGTPSAWRDPAYADHPAAAIVAAWRSRGWAR